MILIPFISTTAACLRCARIRLIAKTVVYGDLLPVFEDQDRVMAYYRKSADQTLLVIGNYKTQPQTLTLPSKIKNIVLNNLPQLEADGNEITLEGYQAIILEI